MNQSQLFHFDGDVPDSKSWLNRALILKSWNSKLNFEISTDAEDVVRLQKSLDDLAAGKNHFDAGHGGTTFRFLVNRVSRLKGKFKIQASKALMKRPHSELSVFLEQMGVVCKTTPDGIEIESTGWKDPKNLVKVSASDSSQFLSSVFLSAVGLDFPLSIAVPRPIKSQSYLNMTLDLMKKLGALIESEDQGDCRIFRIPSNMKLNSSKLTPEIDVSSAFSLAACAVAGGKVKINNWTTDSLQPDRTFLNIFKNAGIDFLETSSTLSIERQKSFHGVQSNIADCPDLFPVLCALFSQASTSSKFFGAPHLKLKESDRIEKTFELLIRCGIRCVKLEDGLEIQPKGSQHINIDAFQFDPADDHRMAMAAALMQLYGYPVEILNSHVVNKSYSRFFKDIGLQPPMKRVFFGHRGVGKSSLLVRHKTYFPQVPHFDLDEEISKSVGKTIAEIFSEFGELHFRKIELRIFNQLIQKDSFALAVGGGFDVSQIPTDCERIYVRRKSDQFGRIFLNRPRLNSELGPIQEFQFRFKTREPKFLSVATWIYDLPEGDFVISEIESEIFKKNIFHLEAYVTLHSEVLSKFSKTELRSDLLSKNFVISKLSENRSALLSLRRSEDQDWLQIPRIQNLVKQKKIELDWALEIGNPTVDQIEFITVISSHNLEISQAISALSKYPKMHLKLCPIVNSFSELKMGHDWQAKDPLNRSFLPRTDIRQTHEARWQWYRIIQAPFQKINFASQHSEISDQPSVYQMIGIQNKSTRSFGAVLGDPVLHSWTPAHHAPYFKMPVVAVPMTEPVFQEAISVLQEIGLVFAAVTSPLKNLASQLTQTIGCNSIFRTENKWAGLNTDVLAMDEMVQKYIKADDRVCVWGGGGILEAISNKYPNFRLYSSRTGHSKTKLEDQTKPTVVIWAAPRHTDTKWPPADWCPRLVLDLNYSESSMGLEWAQKLGNEYKVKTQYLSGSEFFLIQAKHQVKFFQEHIK